MAEFWDTRGYFTEGWARLERAVAAYGARGEARLSALLGAAQLAYRLDRTQQSDDIASEAFELARELGDKRREAAATDMLATCRAYLSPDAVVPLALRTRALAKSAGDATREAWSVFRLGRAVMDRGEYAEAQDILLESARLWDDAGCVLRAPTAILFAGDCAFEQLNFAVARRLLEDALIRHRRMGNVHDAATALRMLGALALNEQRLAEGSTLCSESLRMFRALHDPNCGARAAEVQAEILLAQGDSAGALRHAEAAAATFRRVGFQHHSLAGALALVARVHGVTGNLEAARRAVSDGLCEQRLASHDQALPELLEAAAAMHANARVAATLLGCAEGLRKRWNLRVFPVERAEHERCYAAVRASHSNADFDDALEAGRAMPRDEAIGSALALFQDLQPAVESGRERETSDRFRSH
jgi:hypothetical protein